MQGSSHRSRPCPMRTSLCTVGAFVALALGAAACGEEEPEPAGTDAPEESIDDDLGSASEEPVDEDARSGDEVDGDEDAPPDDGDEPEPNQQALRAGPFVNSDGFEYYIRAELEWQPASDDPLHANPGETDVEQNLASRLAVENAMDERAVSVSGPASSAPVFTVYGKFDADRPICQLERFSETQTGRYQPWPWAVVSEDSCWFPYGAFSPESLASGGDRLPEIMPGEEASASHTASFNNLGGVSEDQGEELTEELNAGPDGIAVLVGSGTLSENAHTPLGPFDRGCFEDAPGVPRSGSLGRIVVLVEATFDEDSRSKEVDGCS